MDQYWDRQKWLQAGTVEQRRKWAKELPLAWVLEYQPTILFPGKGEIPFEPWPFQQTFLNCRERFRLINKPRQCGISTTAAAEVAWEFDNVPGAQIVIISKDKDAAINFHTYVYQVLKSVRKNNPNAPKLLKTNERVTTNAIGSKITSLASSKESGRSFSATHLIFDELAFIEYAEDIWQAATATLSQTNGRVTAISTPKGRANLFARILESPPSKHRDGLNEMGFRTFNYAWWDVPTYNPFYAQYKAAKNATERKDWIDKARTGDWYRSNRPKYTDLAWKQEFEGALDANVGTVFSTRQIEKVFIRNFLEYQEDPRGVFDTWYTTPREPGHFYATGIDLGRKNDPTVVITYDYTDYPNGPAKMVEFVRIEAGRGDWEMIGSAVKSRLEYWKSDCRHDGTGVGDIVSDTLDNLSRPFSFTKTSKQNIIELVQHAFDYQQLRIPKIDVLYREHQRYIWDDKHIIQDTVMANALAVSVFYSIQSIFVGVRADINLVPTESTIYA